MYRRVTLHALDPLPDGPACTAPAPPSQDISDRFKATIDCLYQQLEARMNDALSSSSDETEPTVVPEESNDILITRVADAKLADGLVTAVHFPLADPPVVTVEEPECTDEDLQRAVDELMTRRRRPPTELVAPLRAYIKRRLADAIDAEDYDTAEYFKEAEDRLNEESPDAATFAAEKKQRMRGVDDRIATMKQKIDEIKSRWEEKIAAFDAEKKEKLEEIKARHEAELDRFEEHWNNPTTVMAFSKPSPQLLQLRKLQKTSALTNDFQRAKELKRRGDELEREETRQAERKATASMKAAYRNLKEKQAKEIEFATMNWRRQLVMMQGERDAELEQANLCMRQLQIKKDECKTAKARPLSCISKPRDPKAIATPRMRRQVTDYKGITTQEKLTLMGFNTKDVIRSRRQGKRPLSSARRCAE